MDLVKDLTEAPAGDLRLHQPLSRPAWLPADRQGDRQGRRPAFLLDRSCAPLEARSLGVLKRDPSKPRALEVMVERAKKAVRPSGLPLVGQVAAGEPILAEENIEDYLDVPDVVGREDGDYILRVRGDSMKDAGILEGDFVVVRPTERARDGEIVVALVGDEATVKRFFFARRSSPAPAGEQEHEADSHPRLAPAWSRRGGFQEGLMTALARSKRRPACWSRRGDAGGHDPRRLGGPDGSGPGRVPGLSRRLEPGGCASCGSSLS